MEIFHNAETHAKRLNRPLCRFFFAIEVAIIRISLPNNPTILAGYKAARDL